MTAKRREKQNVSVAAKINFDLKRVEPLTENQAIVFRNRDRNMVLYGCAGTGKTFLALFLALDDVINNNDYRKVTIFRSAVPSRNLGFMPGDQIEKASLFEEPYQSICAELFGRSDAYTYLKAKGLIEFKTTSYLRGTTLENTVVIIDEFQNMTSHEIHSVVTRIGMDCRLTVCGDGSQDDLRQNKEKSGARDFMAIAKRMDSFARVEFGVEDIVRSAFVKQYIIARLRLEAEHLVEPL